jgi:crotonobetaine/carnitine-CoA ligase
VALLLENRPEFFFHFLALNALGVSIVPVNPDYRHDELLYLMEHSEADLAVVTHGRVADMTLVARERAKPLPVVAAESLPPHLPGPASAPRGNQPGLDSETSLLYTSGTTGRPKGCVLTNFYYLNAGAWYRDLGGRIQIDYGRERFLNPLPLFHMNAQVVTATCAMLTANCLAQPERFSPSRWWKDVENSKATIIHYLGVMPPLLLNQPSAPEERGHRVKFGLGAGVEPELHAAFEERFGFPLVEVWGMTETGRIYSDCIEPRQISTRAFGRPVGGLEAKVVDDREEEVPRGTEGELLVRWGGPEGARHGFFAGYLKNLEATEEAWHGGWFHTGDVVRQMPDRMLVFLDRKKNIIRRSGENIAAAEVEACLQAHHGVSQVAVLAVPDEVREEEVMACVVPMPGVAPARELGEHLQDWCLEKLAYFKAPGWVLFVERLPTTGTQKIQKSLIFPNGEDPRSRPAVLDLRDRKKRRPGPTVVRTSG